MFVEISEGRWVNADYIKEVLLRKVTLFGADKSWRLSIRLGEYMEDIAESSNEKEVRDAYKKLMAKLAPQPTTSKTKTKAGK